MLTHSILHVKCQVSHGNHHFHKMRRGIFMRLDVVFARDVEFPGAFPGALPCNIMLTNLHGCRKQLDFGQAN